MTLHRLERQTIPMVLLVVALFTSLFAWYFVTARNAQQEKILLQSEPVQPSSRMMSGTLNEARAAVILPPAKIVPVALVQTPVAPVTYSYTIKEGDTLSKIERSTCNLIDDTIRRNQGSSTIKSRDIIIAGGVITLQKVEPCSPVMAKAKAFPENIPRVASRGGSPEASVATGTHERQARAPRAVRVTPTEVEQVAPTQVAGMSRRQMYEIAKDNCAAAGWGHKRSSESWVVSIADCIEEKWGRDIRDALHEQQAKGVITDADLEPHVRRFVALVIVESSGNPLAKSKPLVADRDPCYGLSQIQPGTGRVFGLPFGEIYNPRKNIFTGVRVLYSYAEKFSGSIVHGLVAYNIGPHNGAWKFPRFHRNAENFQYARDVERTRLVLERVALMRTQKPPPVEDPAAG